jgi:hypothetical protein
MIKQVLLRNLIKYKEIIEKCCKYKCTLQSDLSLRFWIVWILSCILQRKLRIIILLRNKINSSTVFIKWPLTSAHSKLVTYNDIIISHLYLQHFSIISLYLIRFLNNTCLIMNYSNYLNLDIFTNMCCLQYHYSFKEWCLHIEFIFFKNICQFQYFILRSSCTYH